MMSCMNSQTESGNTIPSKGQTGNDITCTPRLSSTSNPPNIIEKLEKKSDNIMGVEVALSTASGSCDNHVDSMYACRETGTKLAWFELTKVVRNVVTRRRISGRDFNILNGWGFLFLLIVNGVIFGTFAAISIRYTEVSTTVRNKQPAIICILMAWVIILLELIFTNAYLLRKLRHPLIRNRGACYISVTALGVLGSISPLAVLALIRIGVINPHLYVTITLVTLSTFSSILFLGAQVCRQRLIYLLFEVEMRESRGIYKYSYLCVIVWALIVSVTVQILGMMDDGELKQVVPLPADIGFYIVLLSMVYYTYKSRHVTVAFSDWRSNMLIVLFFTITITIVLVVGLTCMSGLTNKTHAITQPMVSMTFVPYFSMAYCLSVCTVFIMGQVSIIAFFDLALESDLDPRATFENRQEGSRTTGDLGITQIGLYSRCKDGARSISTQTSTPVMCTVTL